MNDEFSTMNDNKKIKENITAFKHGVPLYRVNPSISDSGRVTKRKKVSFGKDKRGFAIADEFEEFLTVGSIGFYEFEDVDDSRAVGRNSVAYSAECEV